MFHDNTTLLAILALGLLFKYAKFGVKLAGIEPVTLALNVWVPSCLPSSVKVIVAVLLNATCCKKSLPSSVVILPVLISIKVSCSLSLFLILSISLSCEISFALMLTTSLCSFSILTSCSPSLTLILLTSLLSVVILFVFVSTLLTNVVIFPSCSLSLFEILVISVLIVAISLVFVLTLPSSVSIRANWLETSLISFVTFVSKSWTLVGKSDTVLLNSSTLLVNSVNWVGKFLTSLYACSSDFSLAITILKFSWRYVNTFTTSHNCV